MSASKRDQQILSINKIGKFNWEKIGDWAEQWYVTEQCFLTLHSNPLTKSFFVQGINSIILNTQWIYEKNKCDKWNEDQKKVIKQNIEFYQKLILESKQYINQAEEIFEEIKDSSSINMKKLMLIEKAQLLLWYVFMADIGKYLDQAIDDLLNKEPLTKAQLEQIKNYYLTTHKSLAYQEEQRSMEQIFNSLSSKFNILEVTIDQLSDDILDMLEKHKNKFGWITTSDIDTDPPTLEDYLKRLKDFNQGNNFPEEKVDLSKDINQLLNKNKTVLLEAFNQLLYIDNMAGDVFGKINFLFQNLICKQYQIPFKDLSWYTWPELKALVEKNIKLNKKDLLARKHFRAMVQINGQIAMFYGKKHFDKIKSIVKIAQPKLVTSFKGTKASLGCVQGTAKIVRGIQDMDKVKANDIIIASTTRPDLMPALRRCAGIVTDSGGVTSHAAIVSRELKIPCIVGTKIGTDIIKDGDLILLDANNGIITVLNKSI